VNVSALLAANGRKYGDKHALIASDREVGGVNVYPKEIEIELERQRVGKLKHVLRDTESFKGVKQP
jgi:hypothetical protein